MTRHGGGLWQACPPVAANNCPVLEPPQPLSRLLKFRLRRASELTMEAAAEAVDTAEEAVAPVTTAGVDAAAVVSAAAEAPQEPVHQAVKISLRQVRHFAAFRVEIPHAMWHALHPRGLLHRRRAARAQSRCRMRFGRILSCPRLPPVACPRAVTAPCH